MAKEKISDIIDRKMLERATEPVIFTETQYISTIEILEKEGLLVGLGTVEISDPQPETEKIYYIISGTMELMDKLREVKKILERK